MAPVSLLRQAGTGELVCEGFAEGSNLATVLGRKASERSQTRASGRSVKDVRKRS